jgi:glutamate-1-semialdehyde 2,1-aminomutase
MENNLKLWQKAQNLFPGGVNSPVRAFKGVGGNPIFIKRAKGARIYDENNKEYIDYCMSWGALILGHAHAVVAKAIKEQAIKGTSFGTCTKNEVEFSNLIKQAFPSIGKMRLVNSGTEAAMTALRLARAFTKRDYIIKFDGCYHGHYDSFLVKAGSGLATFGVSLSKGLLNDVTRKTISLPYNNLEMVQKICKKMGRQIACIIVEPVAANMGVVLPQEGFLEGLQLLAKKYGILLIFDEVITGFRLCYGGAQKIFGIKPDLTILGKIIGGGLPIGLVGGRREIMEQLAPQGEVYQAGTLSGNPLTTAAGIATLKYLAANKSIYSKLRTKTEFLLKSLREIFADKDILVQINYIGSVFSLFFAKKPIVDYASAKAQDSKVFAKFFQVMLKHGIYFSPSGFEANFLSQAHSYADLHITINSAKRF